MITLPHPLDTLLRIEPKTITHLYGGPGVGKTNICLLAAMKCLSNGGTVTYIDSEGGLSFERLSQIMPNYKLFLRKINLLEPKNFSEQGKIIRELKGSDLVIVDSLSALYRLKYAEANQKKSKEVNASILEANRELSKQLSILSNHARENGIPVIVTSHTFKNWETGESEIVGGETVKYWSKGILFIEKTGRSGERKAILKKHRSRPEGISTKFIITQDGIKAAGFKLF